MSSYEDSGTNLGGDGVAPHSTSTWATRDPRKTDTLIEGQLFLTYDTTFIPCSKPRVTIAVAPTKDAEFKTTYALEVPYELVTRCRAEALQSQNQSQSQSQPGIGSVATRTRLCRSRRLLNGLASILEPVPESYRYKGCEEGKEECQWSINNLFVFFDCLTRDTEPGSVRAGPPIKDEDAGWRWSIVSTPRFADDIQTLLRDESTKEKLRALARLDCPDSDSDGDETGEGEGEEKELEMDVADSEDGITTEVDSDSNTGSSADGDVEADADEDDSGGAVQSEFEVVIMTSRELERWSENVPSDSEILWKRIDNPPTGSLHLPSRRGE